MFIALYITVVLIQLSIGQESVQYESEIPDVDTTPNDNLDGNFIIQPITVEDNDDPMNDYTPVNDENYKDDIEEPIEPVYITEPVKELIATATNKPVEQALMTTIANYETEESIDNALLPEIDSPVSDEVSDEQVSFEGPVHARGKVVVGSHYGCGASFGMPPVFSPWFPQFHPHFYYPPYPVPRFTAQYPNPYLEPGLNFQDIAQEPGNQDLLDLSVASTLGNSVTDDMNGILFGGIVPASGTVSIAARF